MSKTEAKTDTAERGCLTRLVSLRCWWLGCDLNPHEPEGECPHCNRWWDGMDPDRMGMRWRIQRWWEYQRPGWMRPTTYFRKCRDCGRRWNKHTDDCPPF